MTFFEKNFSIYGHEVRFLSEETGVEYEAAVSIKNSLLKYVPLALKNLIDAEKYPEVRRGVDKRLHLSPFFSY
jgi:hypothetical protein